MSYNTARLFSLIAGIIWIISLVIPYSRLGVAEMHINAIRIAMTVMIAGALVVYAVFTT